MTYFSNGHRERKHRAPPDRVPGKDTGILKITLDEKRALSVSERRYVSLDNSVPDNEEIARLVETLKKAQETEQRSAGNAGENTQGTDGGAAIESAGVHGAVPERTNRKRKGEAQ